MENIRIAHIIPSLAKGGAERLVLDICNALQTLPGVEVKLIIFSPVDTYPQLSKTVDVEVIPTRYIPSLRGNAINETGDLLAFFNRFKPHIINTHLFEAEIAARATGYYSAAYVTHCHYNTVEFKALTIQTFVNKLLLTRYLERAFVLKHAKKAKANGFIAISKDTQTYFEQNLPGYLAKNVVFMLNAINYALFAKGALPVAPANEVRLINTGSFIPRKNQQYLVRVLQSLKEKGVNAKLVLLGDGVERATIDALAKELNVAYSFTAPGNVDNVEDYLANSHLYLHAAIFEPFGLVLVEAMAAGLPVIALDGMGNRDVNVEGKTGYLLPDDTTPAAFADKIMALAANPALYNEMAAYARNFASGFDITTYTGQLMHEYKKLLV